MQDLEFPFLTSRIVSGLTGLSPRTLRRWESEGISPAPRRRGGRRPSGESRLYSWHEVERLQHAAYLLKTRRLSLPEVKRLLTRRQAASAGHDWVIARPKPRVRGGGLRGVPARRMR